MSADRLADWNEWYPRGSLRYDYDSPLFRQPDHHPEPEDEDEENTDTDRTPTTPAVDDILRDPGEDSRRPC